MHLKRTEISRKVPITRKGTKYVARANGYLDNSVPVVIAVRDMLQLAKTTKEVTYMVRNKLVKLNGREVKDVKEPVKLFNVLEADKKYRLTFLPTGRFTFEEYKGSSRMCKAINKKIVKGGKVQVNFHDGTNVITDKKIKVGDTAELDFSNKVIAVHPIEKGKKAFVITGKSVGKEGKIEELNNGEVRIKLGDKEVELEKSHVMVI